MKKYIPSEIESKWQAKWLEDGIYAYDPTSSKKKFYTLVELPYTSGDLHVGHWFSWATPDIYSRFKRMTGHNVFFPHGYDTTGLPAENAAIKRGIHPRDWTMGNIDTMQKQFRTMGSMINLEDIHLACSDDYMKWNQWIFTKMYDRGIAYRGTKLSNWCPTDQTVLADEHVVNGRCWRCDAVVEQKEVSQWFLRITKYADELLWPEVSTKSELSRGAKGPELSRGVDWPTSVRVGQNAWIGRKEGIELTYQVEGTDHQLTVFTTRPDTNYGATFIALAPEHPLVKFITTPEQKKEVDAYIESTTRKTELERMQEGREKTGASTGAYVINPLTGYRMPVWVSDFVLIGFGTGALVGVPAHDKRDFEFAHKFGLHIKRVVVGSDGEDGPITTIEQVQEESGKMINSDFLNGMDIQKAIGVMMDYMEREGWGRRQVNYHIRDWSVSRQRYWGTPVPMIHCTHCGVVPVPEKDLPVTLPYDVDFTPRGKAPLASNEEWMKVDCPTCGRSAQRDPETLDTFFDSAWYFFRYMNNHYEKGPFDTEAARRLMPLDIYFGGAEHTLGHTLYARFFTKFFKDLGLIDFDEFALKRVQHGIVLGPDGNKMSKSKGNVINPDDVVRTYGADAARLYLSFMMPYEGTAPWSDDAIAGVYRFLQRVWQLREKVSDKATMSTDDTYELNSTIQKVARDLGDIKCNTAIAFIMTWLNYLSKRESITSEEYKTMLILLAPFAPHITEELWAMMGQEYSVHNQDWPTVDESALVRSTVKLPVQVNGRLRGLLMIDAELAEAEVVKQAMALDDVRKYVEGHEYKTIYVRAKVLNFVV